MNLDRRAALAGLSGLPFGLAACGAKPARAATLRFATDWRAEAEHGGYYQALATGEFSRRGLEVEIIPGGPGVSVPALLAAGAAELGIGSNSLGVLNLAAAGAPVRAVMACMQKDPQVLLAHPDGGVRTLADLPGHPILLGDEAVATFWPWLKAKYGLSDAQVRKYAYNSAPFLSDARAVEEGYVSSEPFTVRSAGGFEPRVFLLADNGYPGYASMVLASDRLIADRPAAVRAFVEAAAAGWRSYLYGDARPGDALILKANADMRPDLLGQAREAFRAYRIFGPADAPIGAMSAPRWKAVYDMALGVGLYKAGLDWRRAFSLDFLPAPRAA